MTMFSPENPERGNRRKNQEGRVEERLALVEVSKMMDYADVPSMLRYSRSILRKKILEKLKDLVATAIILEEDDKANQKRASELGKTFENPEARKVNEMISELYHAAVKAKLIRDTDLSEIYPRVPDNEEDYL